MPDKNDVFSGSSAVTSAPVSSEQHPSSIQTERFSTPDARDEHYVGDAEGALQAIRSSSRHIIDLFVPVTLCMVIVVATVNTVPSVSKPKLATVGVLIFGPESLKKRDTGTILLQSVTYALIILGAVIIMSIVVILLYKWRFYKILRGFLFLCSVILLFYFCFSYLQEVLTNYNKAMDYITVAFVIWNYGIVGLICIHFSGPIILQQAYLIINSAFLALNFIKLLPDWSIWLLLAIISVWDLIAVLCPMGPLRILVETAQERQEPLFPSLVYSTRMIWFYGLTEEDESKTAGSGKSSSGETHKQTKQSVSHPPNDTSSSQHGNTEQQNSAVMERDRTNSTTGSADNDGSNSDAAGHLSSGTAAKDIDDIHAAAESAKAEPGDHGQSGSDIETTPERIAELLADREDSGVKLGLGDFIFYSILVGKASATSDWNTTIACFIAILVGLCLTLLLLFIFRKALPALPISIAFGLTFYFVTSLLVVDFVDRCQLNQIYI